jgi:hypothetical protein
MKRPNLFYASIIAASLAVLAVGVQTASADDPFTGTKQKVVTVEPRNENSAGSGSHKCMGAITNDGGTASLSFPGGATRRLVCDGCNVAMVPQLTAVPVPLTAYTTTTGVAPSNAKMWTSSPEAWTPGFVTPTPDAGPSDAAVYLGAPASGTCCCYESPLAQ